MMYTQSLSIYEYDDYLKLIKDLIFIRKSQGLPFSFRWFSQKAGFTSPNYLHLVLNGKRHLSTDAVHKVGQVFRLGSKEQEYLSLLVEFNKSKSLSERAEFGEKLLNLRLKARLQHLQHEKMNYYLSWRNIAIRECLLLNPQGLTQEDLCHIVFPNPSPKEVTQSLEVLQEIDLAFCNKRGEWFSRPGNISSGDRVSSSALITYHLQTIELAKQSLDRFSADLRDVSNVCVPLSKENFEKLRLMIQQVRAEALKLSEQDSNAEFVAQINFQLFPVAIKKGFSL